jgi:hypothetical protein
LFAVVILQHEAELNFCSALNVAHDKESQGLADIVPERLAPRSREGAGERHVRAQLVRAVQQRDIAGLPVGIFEVRDGHCRPARLHSRVGSQRHGEGVAVTRVTGGLANLLYAEEGRVDLEGFGVALQGHLSVRRT